MDDIKSKAQFAKSWYNLEMTQLVDYFAKKGKVLTSSSNDNRRVIRPHPTSLLLRVFIVGNVKATTKKVKVSVSQRICYFLTKLGHIAQWTKQLLSCNTEQSTMNLEQKVPNWAHWYIFIAVLVSQDQKQCLYLRKCLQIDIKKCPSSLDGGLLWSLSN